MAVYVVKNNNPWGVVGLNLGNGLLGSVLGGMFARDAAARDARRSKRLYGAVADSMTPQPGLPQPEAPRPQYSEDVRNLANSATREGGLYDTFMNPTDNSRWTGLWSNTVGLGKGNTPGRESLLRGLAKYGATQQEAKGLFDLYKGQFETADKLGYQDNVASRVGGLDYDVRGNPTGAAQSSMVAQAYGLKPEEVFQYTAPNFTSGHFDAGDREVMYGFDPRSNSFYIQNAAYGINPTDKYQSDADTQQARIAADARRYSADKGYEGKVVSASGKGGQGGKALTLTDKKNLNELVSRGIQLATVDGQFNQQAFDQWLTSTVGNNPEALSYAQGVLNLPQYMGKNSFGRDRVTANPYQAAQEEDWGTITPGQTQPQQQSSAPNAYFPAARLEEYARNNNMTPAQARQSIEAQGYMIR